MAPPKKDRILLVEDDRIDQMAFKRYAGHSDFPFDYVIAGSIQEAKAALISEKVDALVADYMLGDGTVFDLFEASRDVPIVVVTGCGDVQTAIRAMKAGASDYVVKDSDGNYLIALSATVERAIRHKRTETELQAYRERLETLVHERTFELEKEIAERKQAEEALRKERDFNRLLVHTSPAFFVAINAGGAIMMMNEAMLNATGYAMDEVKDADYLSIFVPSKEHLPVSRMFQRMIAAHEHVFHENHILTKDGRRLLVEWHGRPVVSNEGEFDFFFGMGIDITERRKAEVALYESEARFRTLLEDMPAMICRFLPDGTLTYVNSAYCNSLGAKLETLIGRKIFDLIPSEERDRVKASLLSMDRMSPLVTYEYRKASHDGTIRWQEWTNRALLNEKGRVAEYQSVGRDITESKLAREEKARIEKQLQQAQKMEAIGALAGGIAHDFNNILGIIFGYADTMMMMPDFAQDSPMGMRIEGMIQALERARDLVHQILTFSRGSEQERMPVELHIIVKEALKFLRASLPATIEIRSQIKSRTDTVLADPTQIHQVLMNLCTNAAHAMREAGGVLGVNLTDADIDVSAAEKVIGLTAGSYVKLTVSDTGHGIDRQIIDRIFDPYFTTKKPGEGTGVGLAVVHGIVKNIGGVITVNSEPGKGAMFEVFFPKLQQAQSQPEPAEAKEAPGGTERILFVDDEKSLCEIARELLQFLGYQVTAESSSRKALEIFRARPDQFDLVITDMTMPDITGDKLATEMMRIRPDFPVVICTGYNENISPEKARALGIREYIIKPFNVLALAETIRKALKG